MKVLFSEKDIQEKIVSIAEEINNYYGTEEELNLICVLKGSIMYFADLVKHLKMPVRMEFVRLSSYGGGTRSTGQVKVIDMSLPSLEGKNILIVEDIIDTGLTLEHLKKIMVLQHRPKSIKITALLNKSCARKADIDLDFCGFEIDDKFVVGYGLDDNGLYRNLPYIGYYE